ncbi:hypothetical protein YASMINEVIRUS_403 [Yasminevirus sp. GU-2018]|uniref:serine--tRNA ligase n=1 Tax=Yasminevirus sp. GU-2018 TaxID=2420051 RepID=A0A5K0U812_9VIRU|nr:hypothetical protein YASMINEVIRUS_403 [Yasminevirus sp. GU-2018]
MFLLSNTIHFKSKLLIRYYSPKQRTQEKMVLDITLLRNKDSIEKVKESHAKRYGVLEDISDIVSADEQVRKLSYERNNYSKLENLIKKVIGEKNKALGKKKRQDKLETEEKEQTKVDQTEDDSLVPDEILQAVPNVDQSALEKLTHSQLIKVSMYCKTKREEISDLCAENEEIRTMTLKRLGNILHDTVPVGPNDDSNITVRVTTVSTDLNVAGKAYLRPEKLLPHYELVKLIDGVDAKAGSKIAGNRGYFLKGPLVFLGQAVQQLALHILDDAGFTAIQTPFFMNEDMMASVAQLSQFDEELYKVVCTGSEEDSSNTTKYLIATSEQPLTALHSGERISEKKLPIKYAGVSTCFRKEAGRHGKDTSGIFRVHQFEKIEQFIICSSEKDECWEHLENMLTNATKFLDAINIPYRVVNIASGELNLAAAKKYDIEGFFPGSNAYRELVSCSNCTDYHSRNLGIKHTSKTDQDGRYVHMLNATMCAVTRMICVILENYQTVNGIVVPECLRKYMPSRYSEIIPFV